MQVWNFIDLQIHINRLYYEWKQKYFFSTFHIIKMFYQSFASRYLYSTSLWLQQRNRMLVITSAK